MLENTIVTSTGPFVIAWNFRRVQMGDTDYSIRRYVSCRASAADGAGSTTRSSRTAFSTTATAKSYVLRRPCALLTHFAQVVTLPGTHTPRAEEHLLTTSQETSFCGRQASSRVRALPLSPSR